MTSLEDYNFTCQNNADLEICPGKFGITCNCAGLGKIKDPESNDTEFNRYVDGTPDDSSGKKMIYNGCGQLFDICQNKNYHKCDSDGTEMCVNQSDREDDKNKYQYSCICKKDFKGPFCSQKIIKPVVKPTGNDDDDNPELPATVTDKNELDIKTGQISGPDPDIKTGNTGTGTTILYSFLIVALLAIIGYFLYTKCFRKRNNNAPVDEESLQDFGKKDDDTEQNKNKEIQRKLISDARD